MKKFPIKGKLCHYCPATATTRDHIIPKSLGGATRPWNLVPACRTCNTRKASKLPTCRCEKCMTALQIHRDSPPAHAGEWIISELSDWYRTFIPRGKATP